MSVTIFFPIRRLAGHRTPAIAAWGMTLVELMVSLAILVLTTVGGVSGFVMLNSTHRTCATFPRPRRSAKSAASRCRR